MALLDAERLRVSCCCFLMCGMDATATDIGDAGAVALAKALESGQCQLESLFLSGESLCVLPRAVLGSAPFVPAGMLPSVGGVCACGVEGVRGAFGC